MLDKYVLKLKKTKMLFKQCGLNFSIKYCFYKATKNDEKYLDLVYNHVLAEIAPIIEKYKNYSFEKNLCNDFEGMSNVWVCWWQGYDKMPKLCKLCFMQLKKMLPSEAKMTLITLDNYKEYVHISEHIENKFEEGSISMTTYSDILRNLLLKENGGFWIDATIFVGKPISREFLLRKEWWSVKLKNKNNITNLGQKITGRNWSSFIQKGVKGNIINSFVSDAFSFYYEKNFWAIDYFLQNLFIDIAYNNLQQVRNTIDSISYSNPDIYTLYDCIDDECDAEQYKDWLKRTTFFKLTWKRSYNLTNSDGLPTFYSILEESVNNKGRIICE